MSGIGLIAGDTVVNQTDVIPDYGDYILVACIRKETVFKMNCSNML